MINNTFIPYPFRSNYYGSTVEANLRIAKPARYQGMNVFIVDDNGVLTEYWYKNGTEDSDLILKTVSGDDIGSLIASKADLVAGKVPISQLPDTLVPKYVELYADLPDPTTVVDSVYVVLTSSGSKWLPGVLGGTFYSKGFYFSDGVEWNFLGDFPFQATQIEVNLETNNLSFVTPFTLYNYLSQKTFESGDLIGTIINPTVMWDNGFSTYDARYFNASSISSGTLSDSRLSANVTLQGNTFNTTNKLVKIDGTGKYPAVDGSQITNISASNIVGTIAFTNGGTGLNFLGLAGQSLRVNAGRTALEYYTPSSGGGGGGATYFSALLDVSLVNPLQDDMLRFNYSSQVWENFAGDFISSSNSITDYDFDITGVRNGSNQYFNLRYNYLSGKTRVYVNGMRLTPGASYDYEETGTNQIKIIIPPESNDLITVDYLK